MQSNISMTYKDELLEDLKDKEYRNAFVSSHISNGIPFQIKTIRDNKKMTQKELGKLARMKQTAICRLENPNYGNFTLKTLKEIAAAFDVALIVRFVPFNDLVKWDLNLSSESLNVLSFNEDPYFQEKKEGVAITVEHEQYKVEEPFTQASSNVFQMEDYRAKRANLPPQKNRTAVASDRLFVM